MNQMLIGIYGFLCMAAIMLSLFKSKTVPAVAFILFPTILGILLTTGSYYSVTDLGNLIKAGFNSTAPTAALFMFSVLYFSVMNEAGMFAVMVDRLTRHIGTSVVGVTMITTVLTIVAHLDGSGASTFLIVIPAMLPIYRKLNMRTTTLLRVMVLPMGIMNLMPWAGPTVRAATVLGTEAGDLWQMILPVQIFGVIICLAHGLLAGLQEKRLGAGLIREQDFKSPEVADKKSSRDKKNFYLQCAVDACRYRRADCHKNSRLRTVHGRLGVGTHCELRIRREDSQENYKCTRRARAHDVFDTFGGSSFNGYPR